MRLRTQFIITMLLFGAILVVMAASAIITSQRLETASQQERTASSIAQGASELGYLANDYLIYRESQQLKRWRSRFTSFSAEVAGLRADKPEQQALIANIQANRKRLKEVFDSVAFASGSLSRNQGAALDAASLQVSWSRMAVQSQGLVSDASRLSELLHQQMDQLSEKRTLLMYVMVGLFGVFILSSYMLTYRRILKSIVVLRTGTAVIGAGNLEFAIEEMKKDEIGDLSRAFNRMTANLKAITASKADLEREIAERKQSEQALKESEAKYRNLFENMTEEVHFWRLVRDDDGQIKTWRLVDANPPTLRTWGRTLDEIRGKTTDEIFGPGAADHYMPVVQKITTEGIPFSFEDYFPHLDKHFRFTSVPLGDYFITTGADITSIKKAQEELRKAHDEMEQRVRERTVEVRSANEALRIHTIKLEQSNRDLEDFAHVASHDLQEPLRKIQTFADLVMTIPQESCDVRMRDYLERMQGAAARMQSLVQDLLRYSRVSSKAEPFTRIYLRNTAEEAVTDLTVVRAETGARIEIEDLPEVTADRVQMRQLFQNLIGNALKYRSEREPVVRVHDASSPSDLFWEIHVQDNGIGFDEEYLDKIFKPFQRLHGRSSPYPGTGMGLAICRRIVERHGGSITARSKPGEGATFIVRLPKKT
jgi:signal transduction histidine kinase/HAMP domain-containing protein